MPPGRCILVRPVSPEQPPHRHTSLREVERQTSKIMFYSGQKIGARETCVVVQVLVMVVVVGGRRTEAGRDCGEGEECVPTERCRVWCSKIKDGAFNARGFVSSNLCGFEGGNMKVCCDESLVKAENSCESEEEIESNYVEETPPELSNRQFEEVVEDVGVCGVVQDEEEDLRVAGGEDVAQPGAWPWMARLIYRMNVDKPETTFCGGALVSLRHVITAAHCVTKDRLGEPVAVVLGELDVKTEYDCLDMYGDCGANGVRGRQCFEKGDCAEKAVRVRVEKVSVAGKYSASNERRRRQVAVYDVAVIHLEDSVRFSRYIQPICLPSLTRPQSFDAPHQPLMLKGWGDEVLGHQEVRSATVLQQLKVKEIPISDDNAEDSQGCSSLLGLPLSQVHLCVWTEGDVIANGCKGDSGGPVSRLHRDSRFDSPGYWELAGVVSFGTSSSCGSHSPLVLARVGEPGLLEWVREEVGRGSLPAFPDDQSL